MDEIQLAHFCLGGNLPSLLRGGVPIKSPCRFMDENIHSICQTYGLFARLRVAGIGQRLPGILAFDAQADRRDHMVDWGGMDLKFVTIEHVGHLRFWQSIKTNRKEIRPFCPAIKAH